ncbi:Cullin [Mycena rebaudengoi]|nr:Cullin [Mycena rebaudengoi]
MATPTASTSAAALFAKVPPRVPDQMLAFLTDGVDYIMTRLEEGLSFAAHTNLQTTVYNYCTSIELHRRGGTDMVGSDLYDKLTGYFVSHFQPILAKAEGLQDEALLRYYAAEWDRYTTSAKHLNAVFAYLNRYWVKRERDEGRKTVYPVYTLAIAQWKAQFFLPTSNKITSAVLRLIEQHRDSASIDQTLVKKVIDSFVSLGLDNANPNTECLDVYKEHFEAPFIVATERYYATESAAFRASGTVSDYLWRAEACLREEDRVERCLHATTRREFVKRTSDVLIRPHSERMWDAFQGLPDYDHDADLRPMCALLARIPEGLAPLHRKFEGHVKKAGLGAVASLVGAGGDAGELDPKVYVDTLLEVRHKNAETVARSFNGEAGFAASLDKACREFVNCNDATGSSSTKSPELIARYTDMLLRKNNKMAEEEDLEGALNRVMILFKYLEDKDVFQTFYTTKLSKRLIHGVSASDENEASMITKLKEACGFEYANKLQRMFADMSLSKDLTNSFKERMSQTHDDAGDITFSIMVLGTNFWPLTPPTHDFFVPRELLGTYERFTRYYQVKHSGRKLTWLWNYSKCELRTGYLSQRYILMTSAFQTAVLLQYNAVDTMGLDELVAATGIERGHLAQVVGLLVKARVLVEGEEEQYDLNPGFKSKKIRVNVNLLIKAEAKAESVDVLKTVDEDRKYVIQATIVRIMKARKTMKHQPLIQEVTAQRFTPQIPDIKKPLETLLEKEYIARVDGSRDAFAYVA